MASKEVKGREVKAGDIIQTDNGDLHVREVHVNIQLDNRMDIGLLADDSVTLIVDD